MLNGSIFVRGTAVRNLFKIFSIFLAYTLTKEALFIKKNRSCRGCKENDMEVFFVNDQHVKGEQKKIYTVTQYRVTHQEKVDKNLLKKLFLRQFVYYL